MCGSRTTARWRDRFMTTSGLSLSPGSATGNTLSFALDSHPRAYEVGARSQSGMAMTRRNLNAAMSVRWSPYINAIAPELAQGIQPRFVLEKAAVGEYVRQHEGKAAYSIRRAGGSPVRLPIPRDWKYRTVAVSDSPENVPQGFPAELAEQHCMLYVFPSEGARSGQGRRGAARTAQEGADAMTRRSHGRPCAAARRQR